jgi:hypothetical protein
MNYNHHIYIPFLNFYKDEVTFAYVTDKEDSGTITMKFHRAFYTSDIGHAKKIFRKHLKGVCPQKLWYHWGLIKMTKQEYLGFKPILKKCQFGFEYVPVDELLKYEVIYE